MVGSALPARSRLAHAVHAGVTGWAATTAARCKVRRAEAARAPDAVGGLRGAGDPAVAAVAGIPGHVGARSVATDSAAGADVLTVSVDARAVLVRARLVTHDAAGAAVEDVIVEVGAVAAATGPSAAAAHVAAATPADAAGILVARLAGREAPVLLPLVATLAERLARVGLTGERRVEAERTEHGAGQHRAEAAQRFAAGKGLSEGFREFVPVMGHGLGLSCMWWVVSGQWSVVRARGSR
jgi:hypothetical protein